MSTDTSKASQCSALLRHFKHGSRITAMEALNLYGIGRLAARIWDLQDAGHRINSEFVTVQTRIGTARVKQYWMEPQ